MDLALPWKLPARTWPRTSWTASARGTWAVPTATFGGLGLLVIPTIMAQAGGGLIWLPLIRRRIGGFGLRRTKEAGNSKAAT